MKASIRKFLLINLLIAIAVTTTLTALGNYYLDQQDIQEHLDTLMAVSALSYQAILGEDLHERPRHRIQEALTSIPQKIETIPPPPNLHKTIDKSYLDKFNFQVWNKKKQCLLLHSAFAPKTYLAGKEEGFSDKLVDNQTWRVFTTHNQKTDLTTVLAERYDTRNELAHRIAQDDIYIMLLTFPLSGLLIWIIIGRGLRSLDRIAQEVANRAHTNLEPVNLQEIPDEIKPLIDELNKLFFRLQEGFEREKRFAADAAHELRTPLAALKAQAQVALNTIDVHEKNQALKKLIESVNRSTHIVQQLLIMSRLVPEAAFFSEKDEVNLIKVAREVLAILATNALEKQIELEFFHDKTPALFPGNYTAISILISNLVDNAIRYSNMLGKIFVHVYTKEPLLVLEVCDNGPGIPVALRTHVFERFFRILGNKSPGSGLGLAIVSQICQLHNAEVELDTPKEGTGLIVRVFFPLP